MNNSRSTIVRTLESEITVEKITSWCKGFNPFVVLNSNNSLQSQKDNYHSFDYLFALGSIKTISSTENIFDSIFKSHFEFPDWIFGYFSYDVKNQIEKSFSDNPDGILAEDFYFFHPRYVFDFNGRELKVHYFPESDNEAAIHSLIESLINHESLVRNEKQKINIKQRINKEEYIDKINKIKNHIRRGDIYEMNFCMEFFADNVNIDTAKIYNDLNELSPMPFSTYFRINNLVLMCASPERFLAKRGRKIISQPIKGTIKRGITEKEDSLNIEKLRNDPKEHSENVMIVDLVRNDLSRTASRDSVKVEELFGVKTFRQLHQMVSTISSELKDDIKFTDAIKNAFPMGSMTGAPKIRAMELIEEFESTKRGIFSGSVGYITPRGDFDFNVVIRSIIYNSENKYLSFMAGSAITDTAIAESEYDECMLKAAAMKKVLGVE